eukprot:689912-Prymnesium_polylepis.1
MGSGREGVTVAGARRVCRRRCLQVGDRLRLLLARGVLRDDPIVVDHERAPVFEAEHDTPHPSVVEAHDGALGALTLRGDGGRVAARARLPVQLCLERLLVGDLDPDEVALVRRRVEHGGVLRAPLH